MNTYDILIDLSKILHYSTPSRSKVSNETLVMLINSFSVYIRDLYLEMITNSIYSSRYRGQWDPIDDPEYQKYLGTSPTESILELMHDAIEIRSVKRGVVVRFDPTYKYPKSQRTLVAVLNAVDNGTSKFNARPILNSLSRKLNANVPVLWRTYLRKKGIL